MLQLQHLLLLLELRRQQEFTSLAAPVELLEPYFATHPGPRILKHVDGVSEK